MQARSGTSCYGGHPEIAIAESPYVPCVSLVFTPAYTPRIETRQTYRAVLSEPRLVMPEQPAEQVPSQPEATTQAAPEQGTTSKKRALEDDQEPEQDEAQEKKKKKKRKGKQKEAE